MVKETVCRKLYSLRRLASWQAKVEVMVVVVRGQAVYSIIDCCG